MQFFPASCHFIPLRSKYSLQHRVLKHPHWSRLALSKGPNWVGVFPPPHLRTETDPVSETSYFLVSRIPDDGKGPKTQ
jgi:hypothetical protein